MRTVNRALAVATFRAALLNALDQAAVIVFAGAPTLGATTARPTSTCRLCSSRSMLMSKSSPNASLWS